MGQLFEINYMYAPGTRYGCVHVHVAINSPRVCVILPNNPSFLQTFSMSVEDHRYLGSPMMKGGH